MRALAEPAVNGRAAIRAWLEKFPPITEFKLVNVKMEGREDLAYVLGTYTMTIALSEDQPDQGRRPARPRRRSPKVMRGR